MQRIHSNLIYVFLFLFPIPFFGIVYSFDYDMHFSTESIGPNLVIFLLAFLYVFTLRRYKRVYLKDASIYIYGLFSREQIIITKHNLVTIGRFLPFDQLNFKIVYVDSKGNTKAIFFMKNIFIWNLGNALKDLQ